MSADLNATRRVLKWSVPVDDADHPIGAGPVVLVDAQNHRQSTVFVWTEEPLVAANSPRRARVYGTGQPIPDGDVHIGSTSAEPFVWHVYAAAQATEDPPC